MKTKLLISFLLFSGGSLSAEDYLQVMPQQIVAGSTSDDARCFSLQMTNENTFLGLQFDIYLPEGITFDEGAVELNPDRFPHKTVRGVTTWEHSVNYAEKTSSEGVKFYRVTISSDSNSEITGSEGELVSIYYLSESSISDGLYPVMIKNVVLGISGTDGIYPTDVCSYIYVGDSPTETDGSIDLSSMSGTLKAEIVEELNSILSSNEEITELHLDKVDAFEGEFSISNPNCIVFFKEDSEAFNHAKNIVGLNVVAIGEVSLCAESINLEDANAFGINCDIQTNSITYKRTFSSAEWQAFYVPYAMNCNELVAKGKIAELVGISEEGDDTILLWNAITDGELLPNHSYIFKPNSIGECKFETSSAKLIAPISDDPTFSQVTASGISYILSGTYKKKTDMYTSCAYALSQGNFCRASSDNVVLNPFRVYLQLNVPASACAPKRIINDVNGEYTSIKDIEINTNSKDIYYDLNGRRVNNPSKGVYILNGNKIFNSK